MADIIVTIPDEKLPLIKAWVDVRVDTTGWTDGQYADYVDDYITTQFRQVIYNWQRGQYLSGFVFDDPLE